MQMKFVLIFLMLALVVTTHQYFHDHPTSQMPWWSPYLPLSFIGKYQPYILYSFRSNPPPLQIGETLKWLQEENSNRVVIMEEDTKKHLDQKQIENEPFVFPDTQSRVKGFNSDRLSNLNEQQTNGRFLFNFLSTSGTYTNPFFKTATFTSTVSVSITSLVNCVPANQMLNGAAAIACRRKRRGSDTTDIPMVVNEMASKEFSIAPSETLKMLPTAQHLTSTPRIHELSSSKEDSHLSSEISADSDDSRKKRFFFFDKNQFVVSTTVTSFSYLNSTLTVTRNLLNPPPPANCNPAAGAVAQCIACLPFGYIVCPAAG